MQLRHFRDVAPTVGVNVPSWQLLLRHELVLLAPMLPEYVPDTQTVHEGAPELKLYVPAMQFKQAVDRVAP